MNRALVWTMAAMLWGATGTARAQEGADDIPPPPAGETPPPPPGYGQPQQEQPPPPPPAQQGHPQRGYPQDGGYYPQQPPPGGYAQPPPDPGRHKHDGFFLRLKLGPAYLTAAGEAEAADLHYYGGGAGLSFAAGGAITENLILFGTLYGTSAPGPTVEVDGDGMAVDDTLNLGSGNLGIGIAYYVMPVNLYFSGSVGVGTTSLESDFDYLIDEPQPGLRLNLDVGKEWWVSDNWGLGAAINLFWGNSSGIVYFDDGSRRTSEEVTFQTFSAGLHFSATYN